MCHLMPTTEQVLRLTSQGCLAQHLFSLYFGLDFRFDLKLGQ